MLLFSYCVRYLFTYVSALEGCVVIFLTISFFRRCMSVKIKNLCFSIWTGKDPSYQGMAEVNLTSSARRSNRENWKVEESLLDEWLSPIHPSHRYRAIRGVNNKSFVRFHRYLWARLLLIQYCTGTERAVICDDSSSVDRSSARSAGRTWDYVRRRTTSTARFVELKKIEFDRENLDVEVNAEFSPRFEIQLNGCPWNIIKNVHLYIFSFLKNTHAHTYALPFSLG